MLAGKGIKKYSNFSFLFPTTIVFGRKFGDILPNLTRFPGVDLADFFDIWGHLTYFSPSL